MRYIPAATIALLLTAFCSRAQTMKQIHGNVKSTDGLSIPGASVTLISLPDSASLQSSVTDGDGRFMLPVPAGTATIKVQSEGFAISFTPVPAPPEKDLTITMKAVRELKEVTISAAKPTIEYKADRTVFNVENSIIATGGDALDALKKAPGVNIMNNQITVAGKSSVAIMLNGRLQQLSGEDMIQFLRGIQADNLSKIEVITTPPAKFDAEGNAGIINIVTKKNLKKGMKGNVTSSIRRNSYYTPMIGGTLSYRNDKLNASGSMYSSISSWKYTGTSSTYFPGQYWEQNASQSSFNKNIRPNAGIEYSLSKRSTLGLQGSLYTNRIDDDELVNASAYRSTGDADSNVRTSGGTVEKYPGKYSLNLNYELRLDSTGKKLNADADYYSQKSDKTRTFDIADLLPDGTLLQATQNRMRANPNVTIRSVKADVEYPTENVRLSWGAKASSVTNTADNIFETMQGSAYAVDAARTNSFSYTEDIQAVYLSANKKMKHLELQTGVRGEHTHTTGYSSTLAQTTERDYTKLFPSAFISYSSDPDHAFSISFNRRINRPSYGLLNPFRVYFTPTYFAEGNVNLQPSVSHILELRYVLKSKYSFKIIGNRATDYWDRVFVIDSASRTSNITTRNIGNTWYLGTNINGSFSVGKRCDITASLNGGYSKFVPYTGDARAYDGINAWVELNTVLYLNNAKTLAVEAGGYYYSPRQKDYKRWEEISCINVGMRWMLLDKNLILTLNGNDLMAKAYWLQVNLLNGSREYSYDDERSVRFTANYRFGNNNLKSRRDRGSIEEIQRAN